MTVFAEHHATLAGFDTRLRVCGTGEDAWVLFPAVMDTPTSFGRLQLLLRKHPPSMTSVAVELPGYAGSGEVPPFDRWPDFCAALCEWLEVRFEGGLLFAGNSSGGVAATEAALACRRTAGLALLCWSDWRLRSPRSDTLLCPDDAQGLKRLNALAWATPPAFPDDRVAAHLSEARRYAAHVGSLDPVRYRAALARYAGPLLVLAGDVDGLVPHADALATSQGRSSATFRLLHSCGHYPHREQPAALAMELQAFAGAALAPGGHWNPTGRKTENAHADSHQSGSTTLHRPGIS